MKVPLGHWEGSTENATVATNLLADLVDRGLDPEQGILFVIDGAKALRKAIGDVFGAKAPVQCCQRHKERNVLDHLGEDEQGSIRSRLRAAWALTNHGERSPPCAPLPPSWSAPTPTLRSRCARAWRRR